MGDDYGKLSKFPRLILLCGKPRERQISPLKVYLKHKTLTCVRRVSPSPSPCPTAGASHFENEWEPPNSRLPKALAEYVRQLAISISPADRLSPATVLPQGERGLEGTVLAALWVQGQEKETSFLDSAGRVRETKGKGGGWCPKGPSSGPSPAPGGRPHQHRRRGARKEGGAVSRPGAELWMSFRGGGTVPAPSPPRLASGATAVEPEGGQKTAAGPGGAPGRAHQPGHLPQACQPVGEAGCGERRRLWRPPWPRSRAPPPLPPTPRYLHCTTEEGARVGRQLLHVEVHDVHPGRQPGGAAG